MLFSLQGIPSSPTLLPLTEESVRETEDSNVHSLTLHWTLPTLFPSRIFRYILNATPPAPPCGGSCEIRLGEQSFTRRDYQFLLTLGQRHSLSLRADNCEDNVQSSPQSNILEVFLQGEFLISWNAWRKCITFATSSAYSVENYNHFLFQSLPLLWAATVHRYTVNHLVTCLQLIPSGLQSL